MSKQATPRREADNEAKAVLRTIRVSPRKLDLVAATIRGKKAASAVNELTFSKKRIAQDVRKALNARAAGIIKPFSHLTIVVRERAETEDK
jgi:large subunit ribosomal protein L22